MPVQTMCDILAYQMRHEVMCFTRLIYQSESSVTLTVSIAWSCVKYFLKCFSAENIIILSLNTVRPIVVMVWLSKVA